MTNFWQKLKELNEPITVLAPMDDVTDTVFREIITTTAKPSVLFTEFTSTDAICSRGYDRAMMRFLYTENQRPIVAQIWGSNPDHFYESAQVVQQLGFDGIDINMGCPDHNVMKKNSGAALIKSPILAGDLINAVKKVAPNIPLSVKTRLADDPKVTEAWFSYLLGTDIDALTLHARTAKEMSKVPARWEELGKLVKLRDEINPKVVIIGNGDIKSYQEILDKKVQYRVDGVMVGRGIFANPWLFEKEAKEHSVEEHIELMLIHTKKFVEQWGKTKNFETMKKFFKMYIRGFVGADDLRARLMECKNYEEVLAVNTRLNP